ncbi:MAG: hypothetical protein AAFV78_20695 [Bacteroidota bacterium]
MIKAKLARRERIEDALLYLKGGKVIHISSLVVSPRILINAMGFEYEIKERVFNPFPAR